MRVQLVTMPWHPIDLPSLQLGLLHRLVRQARPADEVTEFHGSLHWAEFLLDRSGGRLRPGDYVSVGSDSIFHGLGDWVFSGVLYDDPDWGVARLRSYAAARDVPVDTALDMRPHAAGFIAACATEVLAAEPDVVGFTSTFMQNVASLALAKELKRRRPDLTVVFGGGNCDGPMGHALHRNHRFVDHVVRGEGEHAFPALLRHLDEGTEPTDVPGLCWWDGHMSRANTETRRTTAPADIPTPDYDQWQTALEASPVQEPRLSMPGWMCMVPERPRSWSWAAVRLVVLLVPPAAPRPLDDARSAASTAPRCGDGAPAGRSPPTAAPNHALTCSWNLRDVPVAGDGQASRTNHSRRSSVGDGSASALDRSCHTDRSQPVAPVPVPTSTVPMD